MPTDRIAPRTGLIVTVIFWLLMALPAGAADSWPAETTTGINLRRAPGLSAAVLTALTAGERLTVVDRQGDWLQVVVEGANYGFRGWVYGSYVKRVEEETTDAVAPNPPPALPVQPAAATAPAAPVAPAVVPDAPAPIVAHPTPPVSVATVKPAPLPAAPAPIPSARDMAAEMTRQALQTPAETPPPIPPAPPAAEPAPPAAVAAEAAPSTAGPAAEAAASAVVPAASIPVAVTGPPAPGPDLKAASNESSPGPVDYLQLLLRLATTVLACMALLIAQRAYLLARQAAGQSSTPVGSAPHPVPSRTGAGWRA